MSISLYSLSNSIFALGAATDEQTEVKPTCIFVQILI